MRALKRRYGWLAFLALAGALAAAPAQAKPSFSGVWKMNVAQSDFGPMPAPVSRTDKIEHADPDLKVNVTQEGQQGSITYDLRYTTDGKESVNSVRGNTYKSTAKWDGDALLVETKGTFNGNEFTAKDKWTLSADGKTITIERHLASAMGEADQKWLFEKQ